MARIEKLQIQGLRSFGPHDDDKARIDFVSNNEAMPLTLILGQNGCGKTTIIECLRYITTGDCPPGSHGGRSFVHDPKMARENRVIGHVKLQFRGVDGRLYFISRTIEATQKAKTINIKTLDAMITRKGINGEPNSSIGGKCADTNAQMTIHLGVSKPILNYVIFCHQEDSNWPLDEGSKVKDKFDEIFASAKYKDCLKRVKDVRSKHMEQLRIENNDLKYLAEDKEIVQEKRAELSRKQNAQSILEDDCRKLDSQIEPLELELSEIRKVEENFVEIEKEIASAERGLEHCLDEARHLESNLEFVVDESEEELERMKSELETECDRQRDEVENIETELRSLEREIQVKEFEIKKSSALIGQFREAQTSYLKTKRTFRDSAKNAKDVDFRDLNLDNEDGDDGYDVDEVLKRVTKRIESLTTELSSKTKEWDSKIETCNEDIGVREIKRAQLEEKKKQLQSSLIKYKREVATIRKQLAELEGSSDKLESIRRRYEAKCVEMETEVKAVDLDALRDKIKAQKAERVRLIQLESELKEERTVLEEQRRILSEIDIKKADRDEIRGKMDKILVRRRNELQEVFKTVPKPELLKSRFYELYDELTRKCKTASEDETKLRAELQTLKESRSKMGKEVQIKERRIVDFDAKLRTDFEISDNDQFETELERVKAEVERTRHDVQVKEANIFTYKEFISRMERDKEPCCPTCNRKFHGTTEVTELISDLEDEIRRIPQKVKNIKTKLEKSESQRDKLQDLLPEKRQCDELRDEILRKRTELSDVIEPKIKNCELRLTELEDVKDVVSMEISTCDDLREDVLNVDRYVKDVENLTAKIDQSQSGLKSSTTSTRDYQTVKDEEESISSTLNRIRTEIETDQATEMRHERRLNELAKEKNELTQSKLEIEARQQERSQLETKSEECRTQISEIEGELEKVSVEIRPLEDEIESAKESKSKVVRNKVKDLEAFTRRLDAVKAFDSQLTGLAKTMRDYEDGDNEIRFRKQIENQDSLAKAKDRIENKRKDAEKRKFDVEKFISEQSARKRTIDDNIRLRNYKAQEEIHKTTIRKYKDRMKSMDVDTVMEKKKSILDKRNSLEAARNMKRGRLDEMKKTLAELNRELNSAKFREAEDRYRKKFLMHRCRTHVIADLNKYYVALDWAIMKFHKERMQVINKIIRELWRATYKGNDIDYIEIKTDDANESATVTGADKRRTYNYRVMMIKNDTELEMRGRCSAGQKVLASLIIRLALAETFSTNCGIIALDEPTTNLDRENITSLADALARIVQERSSRSNFQLIVITHDEDLIDQLGRVERVEKYYKVSRNENGVSQIRKYNIHNIEYQD